MAKAVCIRYMKCAAARLQGVTAFVKVLSRCIGNSFVSGHSEKVPCRLISPI